MLVNIKQTGCTLILTNSRLRMESCVYITVTYMQGGGGESDFVQLGHDHGKAYCEVLSDL